MEYPKVKLTTKALKKFLKGNLWFTKIDCLEFEKIEKEVEPGSLISLYSQDDYFLAQAYINPKTFYCIKILSKEKVKINEDFFFKKFEKALRLRKKLYSNERCFRLIHAEGDYLPGLIIDIFQDLAVIQLHTLGMENLKSYLYPALKRVLPIKFVVYKNDFEKRKEEGLSMYIEAYPKDPQDPYLIEMDEIKFLLPIKEGQKTGFFLDQRDNRRILKKLSSSLTVIDAFSYIGAFSFYALKGGAKRVFLIDRSSKALDIALEIAKINGWKDKIILLEGDVFKILKEIKGTGDILILDPPAFIKSKQDLERGMEKYRQLYTLGTNFFEEREGFLFLFSCSSFLRLEDFKRLINEILTKSRKPFQVLKILTQSADHPINSMVEETFYLKGMWLSL